MNNIIQHDERRGLPSASSFERLLLCPGSLTMERGLPDVSSAIAEEGTFLHEVLAGKHAIADLEPDDAVLLERVIELEKELAYTALGDNPAEIIREQRLWYGERFSGSFDALFLTLDRSQALIVDYKFGYIPVANIAENIQLRAYALLVSKTYGIKDIFVAVIQPRCASPKEICRYTVNDLLRAEEQIVSVLDAAHVEQAPRNAGAIQCKYCKANAVCPEARQVVEAIVPALNNGHGPLDIDKRLELMPAKDLSQFLDICDGAEGIIDSARKEAKRRLTEGLDVPDYRLKPGNEVRKIEDPVKAYDCLKAAGVTASEFMGCCSVPVGKLESLFTIKKGLKGKGAKDAFNAAMGPTVTLKQNAPSLVKVAA
jgi:hypothetical protein